jgi:hypothetical protein
LLVNETGFCRYVALLYEFGITHSAKETGFLPNLW